MFNYLGIEQAVKYINSKVDYDFTLSNLKELQTFGYISTVFFYEGVAKFSLMDIDAYCSINGYFRLPEIDNLISTEPIYFETCLLSLAANDYQDSYGDITVSLIPDDDNGNEIMVLDRTNKVLKVNPYDYNFKLTDIDEQGEIIEINVIAPDDVRISKKEIDSWLNSATALNNSDKPIQQGTDPNRSDELQAKIAELEKQLEQAQADNDLLRKKVEDNKELEPSSTAAVTRLLNILFYKLDYDVSAHSGTLNKQLIEYSKHPSINTKISKGFLTPWLKRVQQLRIDAKTGSHDRHAPL